MKRKMLLSAAPLMLATLAPGAGATTALGDHFTFSGFGTFGVVRTNSDEGQFMRDGQKSGATTNPSEKVDSNLGLQLTGRANSWLSATVQGLVQQRDTQHMEPLVEWAYVKLEPLQGLSLRLGRTSPTMFAVSDSRNVGYANSWLRPPDEVYGLALLHKLDGLDISYSRAVGPGTLSVQFAKGKSSVFAPGAAVALDVKDSKGLNIVYDMDGITLRAGQTKADVAITAGAGGGIDVYTFSGLGVLVDRNNIVAQAEVVTRRSSRFARFIDANGYYMQAGYRFGNVLPLVTLGKTWPGIEGGVVGRQTTKAVGVRWDAFKSAALKFQVDHIDTHKTTRGVSFVTPTLPSGRGNFPVTKPVTAVSAAIDFVF